MLQLPAFSEIYFFRLYRSLVVLSILMVPAGHSFAQVREAVVLLECSAGGNTYRGDFQSDFRQWSPVFGLGVAFLHKERLNGSFQLGFGKLTGEGVFDQPQGQPYFHFFETEVLHAQYGLRYNLVRADRYRAYAGLGLGVAWFSAYQTEGSRMAAQSVPTAAGGYMPISVMLPTTLGARYTLSTGYEVGLELGLRNYLSDYLDNVLAFEGTDKRDMVGFVQIYFAVPLTFALEHRRKQSGMRKKRRR